MANIPEELLQQIMQMTGMSRDEAEKALAKSLSEMTNGPVFKNQMPDKKVRRGEKPKYDEEDYPHFLPSDNVMKYTVRVSLKGAPFPIWRKFECPSNISLRHLTELIIQLMGWENEHLNQIEGPDKKIYVPCYQYDKENDWGYTVFQEDYKLSDIVCVKGKSVKWEYDFGDSWVHDIRISAIDDYFDDDCREIVFLNGKGECPPEDCGGIYGYQQLLELHEKRNSRKRLTSEEKERLEWYGIVKDYDPEYCFVELCMDVCDEFNDMEEQVEETIDVPQKRTSKSSYINPEIKEQLDSLSPLYNDILSLAFRIRELEPWEDLNDSDNYAIRMSDGSVIYVGTMGYGGESYDVQFYEGQEGFQTYIEMLKYVSSQNFEIIEAHKWLKYKSVMFQDPEDNVMEPEQYKLIEAWAKSHNIEIADEHGYPFPQNFRPHYYPTMQMSDDELSRLKEALEAVTWFSQLIIDTEDLADLGFKEYREYPTVKGGKVVPLIVKTEDGYKVERTTLPGQATEYKTVFLPESEYRSLRFLQKSGAQFCRLVHIPGYIGDESDRENGYSALMFICVDKKDEFLTMTEMCNLTDTIERDVLRQFIKKAKKEGKVPQRIITDDARTEAYLKDLCKQLGIILELKRTRIPQLTDVCQRMFDNFGG